MFSRSRWLPPVIVACLIPGCRGSAEYVTKKETYPDGTVRSRQQYQVTKQGEVLWGPSTFWYRNGQKRAEGEFANGRRHGKWSYWYPTGQMKSQGEYAFGRRNGEWTDWKEGTNKAAYGTYENGRKLK